MAEIALSIFPKASKETKEYIEEIIEFLDQLETDGISEIIQAQILEKTDQYAIAAKINQDEAELLVKCLFSMSKTKENKEAEFIKCTNLTPLNFIQELKDAAALARVAKQDLEAKMLQAQSLVAGVSKEEGLVHFSELFQNINSNNKLNQTLATNSTQNITEICAHNLGSNLEQANKHLRCFMGSAKITAGVSEKLQYLLQCENATSLSASSKLHNIMAFINCIENEINVIGENCAVEQNT